MQSDKEDLRERPHVQKSATRALRLHSAQIARAVQVLHRSHAPPRAQRAPQVLELVRVPLEMGQARQGSVCSTLHGSRSLSLSRLAVLVGFDCKTVCRPKHSVCGPHVEFLRPCSTRSLPRKRQSRSVFVRCTHDLLTFLPRNAATRRATWALRVTTRRPRQNVRRCLGRRELRAPRRRACRTRRRTGTFLAGLTDLALAVLSTNAKVSAGEDGLCSKAGSQGRNGGRPTLRIVAAPR